MLVKLYFTRSKFVHCPILNKKYTSATQRQPNSSNTAGFNKIIIHFYTAQSIRILSIALLLTFMYTKLSAQQLQPDTTSSVAYKNAVAFYNRSLSEELHVFNGKEDKGYTDTFTEGTPYFISGNWSKGTVNYEGKLYENVSLLYDAVRDEVVYLYFDNRSRIQLAKEKVSEFSIMGHHFIRVAADSASSAAPGFYDELYNGKTQLLARRKKNIQTFINARGAENKVFYTDFYFVKKGDRYFSVSGKRSLLHNLADKRKELQQFIRRNNLNFKRNKEDAMTQTLTCYDQLMYK